MKIYIGVAADSPIVFADDSLLVSGIDPSLEIERDGHRVRVHESFDSEIELWCSSEGETVIWCKEIKDA